MNDTCCHSQNRRLINHSKKGPLDAGEAEAGSQIRPTEDINLRIRLSNLHLQVFESHPSN